MQFAFDAVSMVTKRRGVDPFPVEASQEPVYNQVNVAKPLDVSSQQGSGDSTGKELAIVSNDVSSTSAPIGYAGEGSRYGPWMLVKRSNNRRPRNQNANPSKPPTQEKVQGVRLLYAIYF